MCQSIKQWMLVQKSVLAGCSEGTVCAVVPENEGSLCQVRWESHHWFMTTIFSDLKAENHSERLAENAEFQQRHCQSHICGL